MFQIPSRNKWTRWAALSEVWAWGGRLFFVYERDLVCWPAERRSMIGLVCRLTRLGAVWRSFVAVCPSLQHFQRHWRRLPSENSVRRQVTTTWLRAADLEKRYLAAFYSRQSDESTIGACTNAHSQYPCGARSGEDCWISRRIPALLDEIYEISNRNRRRNKERKRQRDGTTSQASSLDEKEFSKIKESCFIPSKETRSYSIESRDSDFDETSYFSMIQADKAALTTESTVSFL